MQVPVFISYHGTDIAIAKELSTSLKRLSNDFGVFWDRDSIEPGEGYETRIAQEIKKAEWFLIVCTGFPRRNADMMWSFYEAGQFRATLKEPLVSEANKRIVCIFDDEPPSILSMFQGVKVCARQRSGAKIDMSTTLPKDNNQLDDSAIFNLIERMLKNSPLASLRDVEAASTREMLREESHKLIKLFEVARPHDVVEEKSLQPRISFELSVGGRLTPDTPVKGYEQSLRNLFSIETEETTWARIIDICGTSNGGKPAWLSDIELAAADIMSDNTPDNVGNKCILEKTIYRVIVARYEVFKDGRRRIYVVFLSVTSQPFDLTRRSSTLLSSLILSIRFREQLIPMAKSLETEPPATLAGPLQKFYRLLVAIEMEARQFGLVVDSTIPNEEAPLTAVFSDKSNKTMIQNSIENWAADRKLIEKIFVEDGLDLETPAVAQKCAKQIVSILKKITKVNAKFIEITAEELLAQVANGKSASRKSRPNKATQRLQGESGRKSNSAGRRSANA